MTFGISTTAYNGYGRFIPRWLKSLRCQTSKPDQIVIVLAGEDHGLPEDFKIPAHVQVIHSEELPHGDLHALGIDALTTDWVMYFSVDDELLPDAFTNFKQFLQFHPTTDVLLTSWLLVRPNRVPVIKRSAIPETASRMRKGFICGHALFRKSDWAAHRWPENCDFPALFLFPNLVEAGKNFKLMETPTWRYLKRNDSRHPSLPKKKRRQAKTEQDDSLRRMRRHYARRNSK